MGVILFIVAVVCVFKAKQASYDKANFSKESAEYHSLNKKSKILFAIGIIVFIFSIGSCAANFSADKDNNTVQNEQQMSEDELRFKKMQDEQQEKARLETEKARQESNGSNNSASEVYSKSLDWNKINDAVRTFALKQHVNAQDVNISFENNEVSICIVVDYATSDNEVLEIVDTCLRRVSAEANIQDSSIKMPGIDYWGGIYDKYVVFVGVATPSTIENMSKWLIADYIQPKVQTRHTFEINR